MTVSIAKEQKLRELVRVFLQENAKLNLSAFRTEQDCWIGNVLDSLAVLDIPAFQQANQPTSQPANVLDVGIGGGFPLLPLALSLPHCLFTGIDATKKKIDAVERIVQALEIPNVSLICGRAEALGQDPSHRERYAIILSRAVAELSTLLELTIPFARIGGTVILWKSLDIDEELRTSSRAQEELSCTLTMQHRYDLPEGWGERQLLVFRKTGPTPEKYPRAPGMPKKRPIR